MKKLFYLSLIVIVAYCSSCSTNKMNKEAANQENTKFVSDSLYIIENYIKKEVMIPMRDGKKLFSSIYIPRDTTKKYPVLMKRTPYSCQPYGEDKFPNHLGPSDLFVKDKYIFVYQDVRGRFMSEGSFVDMRPHIDNKTDSTQIDESSDTYDTVDWLLRNLKNSNGKFGLYGISYPGFYAIAGVVNTHPAIKLSIPKCAISDWFFDDFHHHGTFFLPHFSLFYRYFGQPRPQPVNMWPKPTFVPDMNDGYTYFKQFEPLTNVGEKLFNNQVAFWDSIVAHPDYDQFWQNRNILPHLKNINCAVLVVGGWYDAEDLYGPFHIFKEVQKNNPNIFSAITVGPWVHGGMSRTPGTSLGKISFGNEDYTPSEFYQNEMEFKAASYFLKGEGDIADIQKATMFNTGENKWEKFNQWPPKNVEKAELFFNADSLLTMEKPEKELSYTYVSNPENSVPYTADTVMKMSKTYMIEDQRFASKRQDVLHFSTPSLSNDITISGKVLVDLFVTLSESDADFMVKLIDVYPENWIGSENDTIDLKSFQRMVRSEAFRGRFRKSYSKPEAFTPNKTENVKIPLQDVFHTFKKGHKIMIQIQSTWFPLVDLNPQKYVDNIYKAKKEDFVKQQISLKISEKYPSKIMFPIFSRIN